MILLMMMMKISCLRSLTLTKESPLLLWHLQVLLPHLFLLMMRLIIMIMSHRKNYKTENETLFKKTMKMVKINGKLDINLKASEEQNSSLKAELAEALAKVQQLEDENNRMANKLTVEV